MSRDNEMRFEYDEENNAYLESGTVSSFISQSLMWMAGGLFITGAVAFFTSRSEFMLSLIFSPLFVVLIAVKFILVFGISSRISSMSTGSAKLLYITYAVLNGFIFSSLFFEDVDLLITALGFTTLGFTVMSVYGYTTRSDLSKLRHILMAGLIFLIFALILQLIFRMEEAEFIIGCIGALLFMAFVAYDIQKLKRIAKRSSGADLNKYAVIGALELYLDFLNLFLYILRILKSNSKKK